jgi:hypothetical protein
MIGGQAADKSFHLNNRVDIPYSDNLHLYRARIFRSMGSGDDRLQVRILPHLSGVGKDEEENLPKYGPLLRGTVIQGKTEVEDGKEEADHVVVFATPDFQHGYVLGLMNDNPGIGQAKMLQSYSYNVIKNFLLQHTAKPKDFDYEDLVIVNWLESKDKDGKITGGHIQLYNKKTGDWTFLMTSGLIVQYQQGKIFLRVGSPSKDGGKTPFSSITMTPDKIYFDTPKFEVNAKLVVLGKHNHNLLGTINKVPSMATGFELYPVDNIFV